MGQDMQFEDLMEFLGINCGFYYELGHIAPGLYAVSGNYREAEKRENAFRDSLKFMVTRGCVIIQIVCFLCQCI